MVFDLLFFSLYLRTHTCSRVQCRGQVCRLGAREAAKRVGILGNISSLKDQSLELQALMSAINVELGKVRSSKQKADWRSWNTLMHDQKPTMVH